MNEQRIALYGGTFNPVHKGHIAIAQNLIALFALDEVVFIPANVPPHKQRREVAPAWHRYAMLALATRSDFKLRISTIELDAPERPYTVETLERIKADCEKCEDAIRLFFVMGADSWMEIQTWREWEKVLSLIETIIVTRPEYSIEAQQMGTEMQSRIVDLQGKTREEIAQQLNETTSRNRIYFTDAVMMNTAASDVRRRVREDFDVKDLVSEEVADYIAKYRLYEKDA